MNRVGVNPDYNLFRSPSKAPFYEVSDVFRDIGSAKRLVDGHDQKSPLILVLDNGSTPEDMFAFKMLKSLGYEAIVIDHHNPVILNNGITSVCPYLSYHLNPYIFGLDSQTSAGMLCYEMARFIDENYENKSAPAIAAISDRCNIPETDSYIKNSGDTKENLTRIGTAIDFVAYQMKFDAGKGVFEELYKNKTMVDMINEKVQEGAHTQLMSTLPYLRTQEINGVIFSHIDLEKYTLRFTYPTPGKVIGMIHDKVAEGKENMAVLSAGYVSDMIIIRATKPVLPVQKIIATLQKELPEANVDGGGHEMAGTIKFVPAHLTVILEKIKEMLRDLKHE
jgi:RecJ-like exonuclease